MKEDVRAMGPDFALTGPPLIFEEIRSSIVRESTLATFIAFAANWIIVGLHFRRLRDMALVMLPVTAGSLLTVGAMGAIGIPFNFFNVAGIALLFGFGVDYGIYYMQSRREGPAGGAAGGAAETLRRTGGGIALCALTTLASCGSIILSHYRGLASIGAVLCLGAVFCLLSTGASLCAATTALASLIALPRLPPSSRLCLERVLHTLHGSLLVVRTRNDVSAGCDEGSVRRHPRLQFGTDGGGGDEEGRFPSWRR